MKLILTILGLCAYGIAVALSWGYCFTTVANWFWMYTPFPQHTFKMIEMVAIICLLGPLITYVNSARVVKVGIAGETAPFKVFAVSLILPWVSICISWVTHCIFLLFV